MKSLDRHKDIRYIRGLAYKNKGDNITDESEQE